MKLILPINPDFNHISEEVFYEYFKEKFSEGWILYYNYEIHMYEFDFLLISPLGNIFLVEVKGHTNRSKLKVLDNDTYKVNGLNKKSPKKQVSQYMYELSSELKSHYLNPFISTVICYPYLDEDTFYLKNLDKMSTRMETLLLNDFNENSIEDHLNTLLTSSKNRGASFMRLNESDLKTFRRIFETEETLSIDVWNSKEIYVGTGDDVFSTLMIRKKISDEEKKDLYLRWLNGTKIFFLSHLETTINELFDYFLTASENNYFLVKKFFDLNKNTIFNVSSSLYSGNLDNYTHTNYKESLPQDIIQDIRNNSKFNIDQYLLIHDKLDENILVTAGAGTGKTHSMINRIAILLYEFRLSNREPNDLKHLFAMMTFTREAADNMKKRIKAYLNNMFLLTGDIFYSDCINELPNIKISTIHSYIKDLLDDVALYIGYGKNLKITSTEYTKKNLISKYIDDEKYLLELMNHYNISHYEINKLIKTFYSQLKQKNINLELRNNNFDTASITGNTKKVVDGIIRVIKRVDLEIKENNKKKGQIDLSDLMLFLSLYLKDNKMMKNYLEYMFIDEFQDTDDLQIEIMTVLQSAFGFKLFIVGDIKQCIYRFRGAEDQAFNKIRKRVEYKYSERELKYNYRSTAGLLKDFNDISTKLNRKKLLNFDNKDVLLAPYGIPDNSIERYYYTDEDERSKLVTEYLKDKINIEGKSALLVRYNSEVKHWKEILEREGFVVDSKVSNNFYGELAVVEFYKLVKALLSQNNITDCYQLMLTSYYIDEPKQLRQIDSSNPGNHLFNWWDRKTRDIKLYPAIRVLHEIIYEVKPWEEYSKFIGGGSCDVKRDEYKLAVEMLLESLLSSFDSDYITLEKIEEYLRIKILTSSSDLELIPDESGSESNTVSIMTIHKSKGLEFDYVLIPSMNNAINNEHLSHPVEVVIKDDHGIKHIGYKLNFCKEFSIQNSVYNSNIKDERGDIEKEEARLLYVAMTRAEKELAFFIKSNDTDRFNNYSKMIGAI